MIHGADFDIDRLPFVKVYCIYWDYNHDVISQPVLEAETLWPINLIEAIRIFKPIGSAGVNCTFEYTDGSLSDIIVFKW